MPKSPTSNLARDAQEQRDCQPDAQHAATQEDRRCVRTRRLIIDAFFDLLQERNGDDFTVSDLVERADINRSTFYSHFKDRDDLVAYCERQFLDELGQIESRIAEVQPEQLASALLDFEPLPQLVALFDFLHTRSGVLRALLGPDGDMGFELRLLDMVSTTVVNRILAPKYRDSESAIVAYYTAFFAHASTGVVRTWLHRDMRESSEDMARILTHIAFLRPGEPIEMEVMGDE